MKKIILISCVSKKLKVKDMAYKLYSPSTLFKAHWNYAIHCLKAEPLNNIFIISALHGLLEPTKCIDPYNVTLKTMTKSEKEKWADKVVNQISNKNIDINDTEFIILAGKDYYEYLIKKLPNYKLIPEDPLPIGKRMQWFNNQIKNCNKN